MNIDSRTARGLIGSNAARVLDVRTPEEFALEGHIPGAQLLPVQEIAERFREVASSDPSHPTALIVVCEHGVRSRYACEFLINAGYGNVLNLQGGMSAWPYERERGIPEESPAGPGTPSSWLLDCLRRQSLPYGTAWDVACGRGRNALLLARMGWRVTGVDRDPQVLGALERTAANYRVRIATLCQDMETGTFEPPGVFDLVIVINYLHRPLFPILRDAVRPGGAIVYETFTVDQPRFGPPRNPDFLLEHGELRREFETAGGFEIVTGRDLVAGSRKAVSSILARRPKSASSSKP